MTSHFQVIINQAELIRERILATAAARSLKWPPNFHLLVANSCPDFCLNIASWMHSCRGCANQLKLYTLQFVRDSFFLFMSGVSFQVIVWMLSLATCHFSSTFIKQLEWQYLDAIHREAYNVKQLLFYWNHYRVSVWDTSGRWFEDHQWIMTKWVFGEVIWGSSCIFFGQEPPVREHRKNVSWKCCHIGFGTKYNSHVLVKQNILQWVWRDYSPRGV